jgi:ATP-dependent Clp protease ATP-binding subunit ClpA
MKKRVMDAETSDFHQELMHRVDKYIIFKPLESNRSTSSENYR